MYNYYYTEMHSLFTDDCQLLSEEENPYLLLRPTCIRDIIRDELKIKRKNEWEKLGHNIKIDTKNFSSEYESFIIDLVGYSFQYNLNLNDKRILEAIRTGKKIYISHLDIIRLLNLGYSFEDIVSLPVYFKLFIQASISFSNSELEKALSDVRRAISIKPFEDFYELYFLILLKLKKAEYFEEYINHYDNSYKIIIHNETLFKWLRLFLGEGNPEKVIKIIDKIRTEINTNSESKFNWGKRAIKKFEKNIIATENRAKNKLQLNQ